MTTHGTASTAAPTVHLPSSTLLRRALRLDAVVTGLNGAAYLLAAPLLDDVLGLDPTLLRAVGAFLLAYAAVVWVVGSRPEISRAAARAVVAVNAVWALDGLAVAATGWGSPTAVGTAWIVAQAGVVGAFAVLQWAGLRAARG
jgi:hypothetical protein